VHADLWGPTKTASIGGGHYFLSIIDDYSRRLWVFILKHKHETFSKFKEWKIMIELKLARRLRN
jgi:hypothetical protein